MRERLDLVADSVREECLSFTVDREMSAEAIEAAKVNNLRVLRRGISMRNVYQETVRKDPDNLAFAKWMTEHGGPSRTVPTVPFRMLVVDRAVAFLAVNPADPARAPWRSAARPWSTRCTCCSSSSGRPAPRSASRRRWSRTP
ncbi:hypothetical protein ACFQZ4_06620 [Catellatospora coxensis]